MATRACNVRPPAKTFPLFDKKPYIMKITPKNMIIIDRVTLLELLGFILESP